MAHPYDDKGFRHYLKFYDFNMDWYEICEPIGFDAAKYVKKQLDNRWTRDVEYFAIEGLTFADTTGKRLSAPRVCNPQGDLSEFMDYGLLYLLENRRIRGSEMKVGYKVSRNGVDFKEFELDNRDEDITDGLTYYKCKLIEIGLVADHFRNLKNTFNAFSDKNFRDETITPITSFNYLVKATPLNLVSEFSMVSQFYYDANFLNFNRFFNPAQTILKGEVNNTLLWLAVRSNYFSDFGLIEAANELTDITVSIEVDIDYNASSGSSIRLTIGNTIIGFQDLFYYGQGSGVVTDNYTVIYNSILTGQRLYCFFEANQDCNVLVKKFKIKIEVTETDLDLVVPAVRYIDLIKQGSKFVNNLPVVAPKFDVAGQFYNQAVFSRSLLEQRKELYTTNEDLQQSLQEVCADIEYSTQNINIRQHQDFYENTEIASFLVIPSEDYKEPYDEYYLINKYSFGYNNFEQDRNTKNTINLFHTNAEWLPKNERSDKDKKIEIDLVRDPFLKQTTFNLAIRTPSTSTEKDEKLFIEDMVQLAPNTSNEFVRTLLMRWENGKLEILNRNTLGTNENAVLNWNTLGLALGASFEILSGANIGSYTIFSINIDGSILTLTPIGSISQASGNYTIRIKHIYSNVLFQTRTTEGFSIAPKGYSNLAYTIKRNMKYWYFYLATATIYCKKDIANSFFKNFGKLETQLDTETEPVIEDATILYDNLPAPLVEPITIKAKIVAQYEDVIDYLENYRTTKGFVRIFTPTGKVLRVFPKSFEYTLATNEADIDGEKKYEDEFLKITIDGNIVNVNDAPYDLQGVAEWFITKNDYIQLYDKKSNPLSNFYRYDFVILNGIKYDSITLLVEALNVYIWT
jgi:hypothetical protein